MPLYIGDYLAATMHLSTAQHGAYLLLIFHLWRCETLPDDDEELARITRMTAEIWSVQRAKLAKFFEIYDGAWHHKRVERERARSLMLLEANKRRATKAAATRWVDPPAGDDAIPGDDCAVQQLSDAPSIHQAMLEETKSQSQSQTQTPSKAGPQTNIPHDVSSKRGGDDRLAPFRKALAEYWQSKNHTSPEMPWQGRDAKALSQFLAASPHLTEAQFRQMLANRARSAVAHGDRVYLWIGNLTRFQEEIGIYNKPASAGGSHDQRDAVFKTVERALAIAREGAGGAQYVSREPPGGSYSGIFADLMPGPAGRALAVAGKSYPRLAARNPTHGPSSRDG